MYNDNANPWPLILLEYVSPYEFITIPVYPYYQRQNAQTESINNDETDIDDDNNDSDYYSDDSSVYFQQVKYDDECHICMNEDNNCFYKTICSHIICKLCFNQLVRRRRTCPMCRKSLFQNEVGE